VIALRRLDAEIIDCRKCPRLIAHCRAVAATKRRAYRDWHYWGRPVPGFGDPRARVLIVGLAPGAHGANRTGRMFTGDSSGATLFGSLHRVGFASQAESTSRDDGLRLTNAYITASVRCAPPDNKPRPDEIANCRPYLVREMELLSRVRVVVALGRLGHDAFLAAARQAGIAVPERRPMFAHGAEAVLMRGSRRLVLLDTYHPSQQNTQTGRLTPEMLDRIFLRARRWLRLLR
jgi:uracil-DNA glycosylase family 4